MDNRNNGRDISIFMGVARSGQLPASRQGMTGAEAWRLYEQAVDTYLYQFPPRERHKRQRGIISVAEQKIRDQYGSQVWEEFRDARYRAGYHR